MSATSLMITDREIRAAASQGEACQLCGDVPEIMRCHGAWWLASPEGWLRITDCYLTECLDQILRRLDVAGEEAARQQGAVQPPASRPAASAIQGAPGDATL
jgi:hypothetical protein